MALLYIDQHYTEKLSLRNVADAVYLHPTYLSNIFRKQTGLAMVDYINEVRIAQAKKLLLDPRNRIYWIVEQVGFSNPRYFSHVFKMITGMSPIQYRQDRML
jgi:YesN/AraC family two-component response regulator